jgi:hypothetical protein
MPSDPPETLEKGLCATEKYPPGKTHVLQLIWVRISKTLLLSLERRNIAIPAGSTMCNTYENYIFGFEKFSCSAP